MDDILAQLVNQRFGAPQGAADPAAAGGAPDPAALAAAAAAQQGGAPQGAEGAPPAPPKASAEPTQQEKGAAKVAPKEAEGEPSFEFIELDDGEGGKRQMTTAQIKSTLDRYSQLNHRWQNEVAPMKPVMEVMKQLMGAAKANGHDAKPDELAELVQAAVRAYVSNPQMGGDSKKADAKPEDGGAKAPMGDADDDVLSEWEKTNAVKLPPGYKEQLGSLKGMQATMQQMMQMMQQLAQGKNVGENALAEAGQQQQVAHKAQMSAAQMAVKTNVQTAMQGAGLKPEDLRDFQAFAQARGYSPEDFIDPELTATVVQDFSANRQAPEIARLREMQQRRQAFTGNVAGAPGGAAPAAPAAADPMLAQLITGAMGQRNMG